MKFSKSILLLILFTIFVFTSSDAQQKRKIQIEYAGDLVINEKDYPGATILTRDDSQQVHIHHDGVDLWCDRAIHYKKEDFVEAYGNVNIKQGDTINLNSTYIEYSGITKLAFASGDVVLTDPTSTIKSDTLWMDRVKQQSFYRSGGTVVRDTSGVVTSRRGTYYMELKKYQFTQDVVLTNPDYVIESDQLDYYSESGRADLFGPTTITGEESKIYCERGFYDTENDTGYFLKKARIDYDDRIIEGDSLYFDRNRNFASADNNIKITDTINNAVIKGHHAEVFRDKDSVFITKRALAITVQENDSLYIHSDTLMVTGKPENRITRAFYNAKVYKSDLSGKADSIHVDHKTGLIELINLSRFESTDNFSNKRNPILWNVFTQMTGDSIHLISNPETEKLDSLKVFENAFIVSQDTIGDGFHQMAGKELYGQFEENELRVIDIIKNAESIYYMRNDEGELVGTDKSKSGLIKIFVKDNTIEEVRKIKGVDGDVFPEGDFPERDKFLKGYAWRDDERPKSVEDLFKDDPPLNLPIIKGLEDYIPPDDFVDEDLLKRVEEARKVSNTKKEENKAARNIPNQRLKQDLKTDSKPLGRKVKKDNNN
ncbi:OstA-like protein [Flavobacteriaceae sp. LMIT009]